jgi:hypothetical protein
MHEAKVRRRLLTTALSPLSGLSTKKGCSFEQPSIALGI